ncbi:MAG: hypothetical protein EBY20_11970 [Alphaproteobacteria bacterium]|nr:hypothetical protein [Alphaproteobacteria bacterium]NDE19984.1 hypothetical protein [Alphaproteobacteria bacterium]
MASVLISVRNVEEAKVALQAGVDLIDLKDPEKAAMGMMDLSLISQKRNLYEPIKAKVVRVFDNPSIQNKNSEIILYQYEVTINFAVDSYEEVLNVSDDIYKTLPVGAVIIGMQIRKLQALTPEIIQKLSTKDFPGLTEVSIKVLLREIVYEE